jgi:ATP-dependent Clp protease ATP-binding subunit ClpB
MEMVRGHFRPEFLNRLDEIVLFQRLKRSEMGAIVDIQMKRLDALLEDRNIVVTLDPSAREWLADKGYDPAYGARPLKRVIQRELQDPLAEKILGQNQACIASACPCAARRMSCNGVDPTSTRLAAGSSLS